MATETFAFRFGSRYRRRLRLIGVTEDTSLVTVTDEELRVRFGGWRLRTTLSNITGTELTGDYRGYRAIGARGSFADRGVTFGTDIERGCCVCFAEPVPALLPFGLVKHPGMTVTVEDPDRLAQVINERIGD